MSASLILYFENRSLSVASLLRNCAANHSVAVFAVSGCAMLLSTFQPSTRRKAFHILLQKFRPCSQRLSSKRMSFPAGAESIIPILTPSAPYSSMSFNGSGELPSDLDIFLPSLSRTMPVKYTFRKGILPVYSYPAIIIRATQKKIISGPVTRSLVG